MLALLCSAYAGALVGVAWVPAGIGSFSWSDANAFSDTLAGEYDGWLRPPLTFSGGWVDSHNALLAGFAAAFFKTEQYASSSSSRMTGTLRPSLDYRRYLRERKAGRVNAWADAGIYGVIPFATDSSDAYTEEEQADADEAARSSRGRLGMYGAQAGLGAEYLLGDKEGQPAVALGIRYFGRVGASQQVQEEDGLIVSTIWLTEAAVMVEFFL